MTDWSGSLYAIVDVEAVRGPLVRRVFEIGCAAIQLRDKRACDAELFAAATVLRTRCAVAKIPFVVNDRPDVAALVDADELHLGQDDIPIEEARTVVGSMQVGVSTHSLEQALDAERRGADRIAFGPVFATSSKEDPDPVVGLGQLTQVCTLISKPVVAIGGITPENAAEVLDAGAAQVAVISALGRFLES